ncbi:MAG TPA: hypothetical protein VK191_07995 [Symbiobacteriaceae bacterium]|nr:hypothetical protein [Symbiobacteriaceae bacterium]
MSKVPRGRVNIAEALLSTFDPAVFQNVRKELYFNPRAMAAFHSTVDTPDVAVAYDILSDDEVALIFAPKGDDTVLLRRSNTLRTGTCSFRTIIQLMPELRNVRGKQNRYPYRIDTLEDGSQRFVLLVGEGRPTPVATRQRAAKPEA